MTQVSRTLIHERGLFAAGTLNAWAFGILMLLAFGPTAALVSLAGGAFPWACIAVLQRMRRGDSWISSVPLILAMVLTGAGLAFLGVAATWAGTCWDCAASRYTHEPPTRAFMFFVWTYMVWLVLSAALVILVLLVFGGRLVAKLRGPRARLAQ